MQKLYYEDEGVRLVFDYQFSDITVFSFTGVGLGLGGIDEPDIQREEFKKSLHCNPCNRVFIIDKQRTWYSNRIIFIVLLEFFEKVHNAWNVKKTIGIGNSMGGTGAIIFGDILKFDIILSFVPQTSIDPLVVPDDARWKEKYIDPLLKNQKMHRSCKNFIDICDGKKLKNTIIFYGDRDKSDLLHAKRLLDAGHDPFIINDCDHSVTWALKEAGHLQNLISLSLSSSYEDLLAYAVKNFNTLSMSLAKQPKPEKE